MESAGEARPGIWIATTECRGEESSVSTSTTPHTLSCTNLDLALVTTREEGSTLCSVSIIGKRYIGRTVLVMSDMKARLTSRVVPPTPATPGTQWQQRRPGDQGHHQWSCVTSHKLSEEMWRGRHCSDDIAGIGEDIWS